MTEEPQDRLADEARVLSRALAEFRVQQREYVRKIEENTESNKKLELALKGDGTKDRPGLEKELLMLVPRLTALEEFKRLVIAHMLAAWSAIVVAAIGAAAWLFKRSFE